MAPEPARTDQAGSVMHGTASAGPGADVPLPAVMCHQEPAYGASALIAKVTSLLPAGVRTLHNGDKSPVKTSRVTGSFQPGARFSRSQQAFLRIPIVLTGRDESGAEYREETCTLILLPQGAVIPMARKIRTGDRLTLTNPASQKEAACDVFGAVPGPDGKMLVEVEFHEPQRSMWPVSFPAWAGKVARSSSGSAVTRATDPVRAPALDSSGS